jgi:hypothetical protein
VLGLCLFTMSEQLGLRKYDIKNPTTSLRQLLYIVSYTDEFQSAAFQGSSKSGHCMEKVIVDYRSGSVRRHI